MKLKTLGILTIALAFAPFVNAETISGTVTSVDGQKVTILRTDNSESATIFVRDRNSLANLSSGSRVSLDANKRFMGGWEASSLDSSTSLNSSVSDSATPSRTASSLSDSSMIGTSAAAGTSGATLSTSSTDSANTTGSASMGTGANS